MKAVKTINANITLLDAWQGSEYASVIWRGSLIIIYGNFVSQKPKLFDRLVFIISFVLILHCIQLLNPLSANFTKWSNTLKQFVGNLPTNCLSVFGHFVGLALKGLIWCFNPPHATGLFLFPLEILEMLWQPVFSCRN